MGESGESRMKLSTLVYMILICGAVWGGFFICVWLELKNHKKS